MTGGIASGKTAIANYLKELGAFVINADNVAHGIYDIDQPAYQAVINTFGSGILTDDNVVDRKKLGAIVFSNKVIQIIKTVLFLFCMYFIILF